MRPTTRLKSMLGAGRIVVAPGHDMASFKEREAVIDTESYLARDKRYGA